VPSALLDDGTVGVCIVVVVKESQLSLQQTFRSVAPLRYRSINQSIGSRIRICLLAPTAKKNTLQKEIDLVLWCCLLLSCRSYSILFFVLDETREHYVTYHNKQEDTNNTTIHSSIMMQALPPPAQPKKREDGDVPDLVRPVQPLLSGPMDLMSRAIRGFCTPPPPMMEQHDHLSQRSLSSNHTQDHSEQQEQYHYFCLPPPPPAQQQQQSKPNPRMMDSSSFHQHDACSSTSGDEDGADQDHSLKGVEILGRHSEHDDDDNEEEEDDDDNDMLVLVETVPGTHRWVRVGRALEIFVCTVALVLLTVAAVQRLGVQLEWSSKTPITTATTNKKRPAFLSVVKQQQGGRRDESGTITAAPTVIQHQGVVAPELLATVVAPEVCDDDDDNKDAIFSVYHASAEHSLL